MQVLFPSLFLLMSLFKLSDAVCCKKSVSCLELGPRRHQREYCVDGTSRAALGYCAVGKCNIFGCNCDGGCRDRYNHGNWVKICSSMHVCARGWCDAVMKKQYGLSQKDPELKRSRAHFRNRERKVHREESKIESRKINEVHIIA